MTTWCPWRKSWTRPASLIIAAPHKEYASLATATPVIDIWGLTGNGTRVKPRVSIVVPVYNEGDAVTRFLDRLLDATGLPSEVLVVYDFAEDTTAPHLAEYAARDPRVVPTLNTYGRGPANAIRFGIDHATADVVVVTMADGSDDPRDIQPLTEPRRAGRRAASRYSAAAGRTVGP